MTACNGQAQSSRRCLARHEGCLGHGQGPAHRRQRTVSVPDGDEAKDIGKIIKEAPHDFEDLVQQGMTDADNFTMSYPKDIDPRLKAAMAAALLLIDYQFFEDEGDCYCNPFRCVCGYKCCVCSMCGCLLEWGICFGRRGGDGPCCFDCCWCPCCP